MTWFKVDDTLAFHHRVVAAGNPAMGLWVRAGAWSMGQLTDGFVPDAIARQLGTAAQIGRLVKVGLWLEAENGYRFHRWEADATGTPRQWSKAQIERKREADRERLAAARAAKKDAASRGDVAATPTRHLGDVAVVSPLPNPIQSNPIQEVQELPPQPPAGGGDAAASPGPELPGIGLDPGQDADPRPVVAAMAAAPAPSRAKPRTRLREPFVVTERMRQWAATAVPGLDVDAVTVKFVDFWVSDGRPKADWVRAWQVWLRTEWERSGGRGRELAGAGPAPFRGRKIE